MKKKTKSAKKYPTVSITNCEGSAKYRQSADGAITIRLTGRIAANLHKAAAAMNAVEWCDDDNTAATLLAYNVCFQPFANWAEKPPHVGLLCGLADETNLIIDAIDTGADGDEDERRKAELKAAFDKAFRFQSMTDYLKKHKAKPTAK